VLYFADLHIHSRYSRATSRDCNLVELARWAALKGTLVLATGDFTHPGWNGEIREYLQEAESGLFRLKDEHVPENPGLPGGFGPADVRFVLNVEISSIYKKNGATRKVHNLVFMPDLESVDRFNARLDRIGNIKSDGRPILGLDSRDLLEIALETSSDSYLIPAHIWTPWFSILGSRSGFDSVEECFGDLTPHVFALETGLSSDPAMNHRVSGLDRFTLVSNSDTHSPSKLGRQANIFLGEPGYEAIREAIRAGGEGRAWEGDAEGGFGAMTGHGDRGLALGFVGTIEFFPEEGKYHLDGHRKCVARLDPKETEALEGKCPVCRHPVTVGVMNRVNALADREPGITPPGAAPFWRMLPLTEIVAQAMGVGPQSKKVDAVYRDLLSRLGPELTVLWSLPLSEISRHAPEIIVEGIKRVRNGEVHIQPGYDGEYGTVELFAPGEHELFAGQQTFISVEAPKRRKASSSRTETGRRKKQRPESARSAKEAGGFNEEQEEAVRVHDRCVLVQAGPGTGKTRTLTHRIASLVKNKVADPGAITAVTFTRKAAQEMRTRLQHLIAPEEAANVRVGTFHQLGAEILELFRSSGYPEERTRVLAPEEGLSLFRSAVKSLNVDMAPGKVTALHNEISLLKQNLRSFADASVPPLAAAAGATYEESLRKEGALDLDDLIVRPVELLRSAPEILEFLRSSWAVHLLVDEFQDVNRAQYELVRLLSGPEGRGLFVIGDPDQAIYGFRGADRNFFLKFVEDFPHALRIALKRNYRSEATILQAAADVLGVEEDEDRLIPENGGASPIERVVLPNPATEGMFIARTIDAMLGGSSFFSLDSGRAKASAQELGFRDFAVLFRLNAVGDALEEAFGASGIPFQRARKNRPEEEADEWDPRAEAVTLMTIHASKGLEFPVVFVAGCEEGIIPYVPPGEAETSTIDREEEKRLLYVAMTRACNGLFLTRSVRRTLFGRIAESEESSFLSNVDRTICRLSEPLAAHGKQETSAPKQCELFG
jgi:DNA helicase II / ATP-dependent DNA helicase PcrA